MKRAFAIIFLLICLAFVLMGCGKTSKSTGSDKADTESDAASTDNTQEDAVSEADTTQQDLNNPEDTASTGNSGEFECISDISEYWNNLYTANEAVLNAYEGTPIMELVTPGMCFVTGVQYDVLNIFNKDGRYEGNLMLAGYPGFEERKGSKITFGYEATNEEDSEYSTALAGDKNIESGSCDLNKGYYYSESYTDRSGDIINRSTSEFQLQSDKSMCAMVIEGDTLGYNNEENLKTTYIFIRANEGQYDFAVAKSTAGTEFDVISLEEDMTKDMAIAMFESAGAAIEYSGGIKDGAFYTD